MLTLERLRLDPAFMANVTAWERLPERPARYAPFPAALDLRLRQALHDRGIDDLYIHQTRAVEAVLRRENVVIVTGTASGKTLCYNLPVLNSLLSDPQARALYLFPTKALAQDQAAELGGLVSAVYGKTDDGRRTPTARDRRASIVDGPSSIVSVYDG